QPAPAQAGFGHRRSVGRVGEGQSGARRRQSEGITGLARRRPDQAAYRRNLSDGTISHGAQPRHGTPREGQGRPSARRRFLTFRITARLSGGHVLNQITPEAVSLTVERNVLVATIDNPPVNALSHSVRAGLVAAVDRLEGDSD